MPRFVIRQNDTEEIFDFEQGDITLGRDPENPIIINDTESSRRHCQVVSEHGQYKVIDLASKNGTKVNGKAIQSHNLHDGDIIQIGKAQIIFQEMVEITDPSAAIARAEAAALREARARQAIEETRKKRWTIVGLVFGLTAIIALVGVVIAAVLSHHSREYDTAQKYIEEALALKESGYYEEALLKIRKVPNHYPNLYRQAVKIMADLDPAIAPGEKMEKPMELNVEPEEYRLYNQIKLFALKNKDDPTQYDEILRRISEFKKVYPSTKYRKEIDQLAQEFVNEQEKDARHRFDVLIRRITDSLLKHDFSGALDEVAAFIRVYPNHEKLTPEARQKANMILDEAKKYVEDQIRKGAQLIREGKPAEALNLYETLYHNLGKGKGEYQLLEIPAQEIEKHIQTIKNAPEKKE